MSGGHFGYLQYSIDDAAIEIADLAIRYSKTCDPKTVERLNEASKTLQEAANMLQRVDRFVSCDGGEGSFNRRWEEDGLASLTIKQE